MNFLEKHIQLFLLAYMLIGGFSFFLLSISIDVRKSAEVVPRSGLR
jgi:hypothetical protein